MKFNTPLFIVDDDLDSVETIRKLVTRLGLEVIAYPTAEEYLKEFGNRETGIVITELRLPGMGGLELLQSLRKRNSLIPVVVFTAWADVAITVKVMQQGTFSLLEKTCSDLTLWEEIRRACMAEAQLTKMRARKELLRSRFEQLTSRERSVLELLTEGAANKEIALRLDVSVRTVESRRRSILNKMCANNVAQLVGLVHEFDSPVCQCRIYEASRLA